MFLSAILQQKYQPAPQNVAAKSISICGHQAHWSAFQFSCTFSGAFSQKFDFSCFFKFSLKYIYLSKRVGGQNFGQNGGPRCSGQLLKNKMFLRHPIHVPSFFSRSTHKIAIFSQNLRKSVRSKFLLNWNYLTTCAGAAQIFLVGFLP